MLEIYYGSQTPMITSGLELENSYIQLVVWPSGLGNYIICNRFTVQTVTWSVEFVMHNESRVQYHQNSLIINFSSLNTFQVLVNIKICKNMENEHHWFFFMVICVVHYKAIMQIWSYIKFHSFWHITFSVFSHCLVWNRPSFMEFLYETTWQTFFIWAILENENSIC